MNHLSPASNLDRTTCRRLIRWRELSDAVAFRRHTSPPRFKTLVVTLVVFLLLYLAAAVVLVPPGQAREFNFLSERGAVTVLSAVFLAMASGFAFGSFFILRNAIRRHRCCWLIMSLAMGFLALDELLEFHERVGARLDTVVALNIGIRGWNDLIVIAYGIVTVPLLLYFLPVVLRYRRVLEIILVALAFYAIHTIVDSTLEPPTTTSIIVEESCKLFSSAFLALAFFNALIGSTEEHFGPARVP